MSNYIYPQTDSRQSYQRLRTPTHLQMQQPTIEAVLDGDRIIPAYSLVLGMCEDQLPLVLDLSDPSPGSILIDGDSGFANTIALHSMIASALILNTEYEVNVHLLSPQADSLTHFHIQPAFRISYQPERLECEILLEELAALVEARQQSGRVRPFHTLFIDSLDILWEALSPQGKLWLSWLIAHGPGHGVWIIAALESGYLTPQLAQAVDRFPSRILGSTQSSSDPAAFASQHNTTPAHRYEYTAYIGSHQIKLLPMPSEHDC